MRCTRHNVAHCGRSTACIQERRDQQSRDASRAAASGSLADPTSLTHQAAYGGAFYGTLDTAVTSTPAADCAPSPANDINSPSSYSSDPGSSTSCGGDW
ncbi:hypothetical protein [Micromonospora maritima]|uniref:hypothetical protein n=1 Tax=Micromonospora maritima TaxID=986711 RepID=UPI00157DC13D|nr:hypothetical protein [Micromonospora maritima]